MSSTLFCSNAAHGCEALTPAVLIRLQSGFYIFACRDCKAQLISHHCEDPDGLGIPTHIFPVSALSLRSDGGSR